MELSQEQRQLIALLSEAFVGLLALYNLVAPNFKWPAIVIGDEMITSIVTAIVIIGVVCWNTWKNRNFTDAAKLAQRVLDAIKDGVVAQEAVEELLEDSQEEYSDYIDSTMEEINESIEEELEDELGNQSS